MDRLFSETGRRTTPCLFIDGKPMFESEDIIEWLKNNQFNLHKGIILGIGIQFMWGMKKKYGLDLDFNYHLKNKEKMVDDPLLKTNKISFGFRYGF